jgi:hypothetical protein
VWNNPVEAGIVERAEDYRWSSCGLVGRSSPLIDESELQRLLPAGRLSDIVPVPMPLPPDERMARGRPLRHSDEEAAALLYRACGARSPAEFRSLDRSKRPQVIRELRTRSIAYDQIARITGLSATSVRRLHAEVIASSAEERDPDW